MSLPLENHTTLRVKPASERDLLRGWLWIFQTEVAEHPRALDGSFVQVLGEKGAVIGWAIYNSRNPLCARLLPGTAGSPRDALAALITRAVRFRRAMFADDRTDCYRVVNGEGDFLSGLTVDRYAHLLVVQITALGFEKEKEFVVATLLAAFEGAVTAVYEKSNHHAREKEGMKPCTAFLAFDGRPIDPGAGPEAPRPRGDAGVVVARENGILFEVDVVNGQKTGLFLDMREMRRAIGEISRGRRVLNCFCYNGGFSLYAARGGATRVDSVDISAPAVEAARRNFSRNWLDPDAHGFYARDAFVFLKEEPLDCDLVILDPPAFAKRKEDVESAKRGYADLNRLAFKRVPPRTLVLTCSCSSFMSAQMFEETVLRAAGETGRPARVIGRHRLAPDHGIAGMHPDGDYLKSVMLALD